MSRERLIRDDAVVLRTYRLGEADRIVVLMTRDHGKVRGVAKGVRKTRSKFVSRLEPTTHIDVQLYEGRSELWTITQAETIDRFVKLRSDLELLTRGVALLEVIDQIALDREPNSELHRLLVGALGALNDVGAPLVVAGFNWKVLVSEGFAPMLDECVACGSTRSLVAFDIDDGGMRCADCRRGTPVSAEALEVTRQMLGGELNKALSLPRSGVTDEVDALATAAVEHHLERRLRSVGVINATSQR
ncbi:MAG: DNA repair protein RecO [Acidimicrobiia bacterium]